MSLRIVLMKAFSWCCCLLATGLVAAADKVDPLDWPYWRGPEQNGISRETGLPDNWDHQGGDGSNLDWKRADVGGRSTPIVMNGRLYTLVRAEPETPREGEKVVCLDMTTGKTLWENRFNVWLSDVPDTRVGWSSVVGDPETGNVYALGVCGNFLCINGETGKTIWSIPLHEKFGLLSTYGGRTNFPIICDDLVIISAVIIGWGEMARPSHRFLGFDKRTGTTAWFNSTRPLPEDTTYSAPVIAVIGGQKLLVEGAGDGSLWALQPRTGKTVWEYQFSRRGLNVPPIVDGNEVFMGHSEENITGTVMGAMAKIDGTKTGLITKTGTIWKEEELNVGKSAPLLWEGRLYCFDDAGKLFVVDAKTGQRVGKRFTTGTVNRSSPLFADGKIYFTEANGRWWILEPDERLGVKQISKGNFESGEECNASPICSHGRVFIQTSEAMYCFMDKSKKHSATESPAPVKEAPVDNDTKPAHVQVVPCEVLMKPGESQKFTVRLFNARGQFLKATDATFTLQGPGAVEANGEFKAPSDVAHVATIVTAKVGELTGTARVRIVPPLPWKFDFEGMTDAPITWVGARYRHALRKVDGNNMMVKITTIPKGTRSRCWFGQTDLHDYTIQADVRGSVVNDKVPDIGLIAQGYTFDMQGQHQKLVINSWVSHDFRTTATKEFKWKPNQWYTLKFRASNQEGKALLQAKVWPRDEKEPAAWTLEMTDTVPNTTGSPGLFGNATNAEIFIDNVTVTPN